MASLKDAINYDGVRDRLRHAKPMQFVPALEVAAGGLGKYGFKTLRAFVTAHIADGGLGIPLDRARWLIEFNPAYKSQAKELITLLGIAELAKGTEVAVKQGFGKQKSVILDNPKNVKYNQPSEKGGNSATYRIAKLKRDHPAIAKRLEAGEFKNVADAERAAGVRDAKRPAARLTLPLDDLDEADSKYRAWRDENYGSTPN